MMYKKGYLHLSFIHIFLFIGICGSPLLAQESEISDLKKVFKNIQEENAEKANTAYDIADYFFSRDALDSTRHYTSKAKQISRKIEAPVLYAEGRKIDAKVLYKEGLYDEAIAIFDSITPIFIKDIDRPNLVDALIYKSTCHSLKSEIDKASESLKIAEQYASDDLLQGVYNGYAQSYLDIDDFSKALEYLNKSIKLGQKYPNTFENGTTYQLYGYLNLKEQNFDRAIEYYTKAKAYFEELDYKRGLFLIYNNIGAAANQSRDYDISAENLAKASDLAKQFNNAFADGVILGNLADVERKRNNKKLAESYYQQALQKLKKLNVPNVTAQTYRSFALFYANENQIERGIRYADSAVTTAETTKELTLQNTTLSTYAQLLSRVENYKEAYNAQQKLLTLKDSLSSTQRTREIEKQRAAFETEQKEQDLRLREQEITALKEKQKLNTYIYILGALALLFSIGFIYRQLKLTQARKKVLETERELNELKQKQLEQTVEQKSGQVVNFALHIKEKNELLEELKSKISGVRKTTDDSNTKSDLQQIILNINNSISINQNRVKLLSDVEGSNEAFLSKLASQFPDLTDREKNIAGLIRLKMSSKQIAESLSITEMSLNNIRSKIRKKINAPKGTNLSDFFKNL